MQLEMVAGEWDNAVTDVEVELQRMSFGVLSAWCQALALPLACFTNVTWDKSTHSLSLSYLIHEMG